MNIWKECSKCKRIKSIEEFHLAKRGKFGRRKDCKTCVSIRMKGNYDPKKAVVKNKNRYEANREKEIETSKAWNKANRERYNMNRNRFYYTTRGKEMALEASQKRRALKNGTITDGTTIEQLRERDGNYCIYCNILMDFGKHGRSNQPPNKVNREHDIPLCRGGTDTIDNLVLACRRCNNRKGQLTGDEFRAKLLLEEEK